MRRGSRNAPLERSQWRRTSNPRFLAELHAKLKWAEQHLKRFESKITVGTLQTAPSRNMTTHCVAATSGGFTSGGLDPELPLLLSDFINNLRASLDRIAWQLSVLGPEYPSERDARSIAFPIHEIDDAPVGRSALGKSSTCPRRLSTASSTFSRTNEGQQMTMTRVHPSDRFFSGNSHRRRSPIRTSCCCQPCVVIASLRLLAGPGSPAPCGRIEPRGIRTPQDQRPLFLGVEGPLPGPCRARDSVAAAPS